MNIELDPSVTARLARAGVGFSEVGTLEFRRFHNAIRILMSMDVDDLIGAGVFLDDGQTSRFLKNPFRFFVVASDETKAAIWRAIQARQPTELREANL